MNKNQVKNPDISLTIPLGHLEKHLLIADFTFPLSLFFKIAGERIITFVFLFILIVCLIYSLYLQLKNEKRLRNNQELFTHTLVHNLRRPVLNIKCQLENLLLDGNGGNDLSQDEAFEHCRQWVDKTLEDIEYLLTISVHAYGIKAYPQPTDIRELLTQITQEYRQNNSPEKQISIQTDLTLTNPVIWVDSLLLYGALGNLLGNAIKYSGPEVSIHIACRRERRKLLLIVKDNGFGIPEEEQNMYSRNTGVAGAIIRIDNGKASDWDYITSRQL